MSQAKNYYPPDHPVALAVEPLRVAAVERALKHADEFVETTRVKLQEAGWDVDKVAPYPSSGIGRANYFMARDYYQDVRRITRPRTDNTRRFNEIILVRMDDDGIARFRLRAEETAELQYVAYVAKLIRKVEQDGHVRTAQLLPIAGVWGRSHLIVTLESGETKKWLTKTIVNRSPLGTLFNQWPTTRLR